MDAYTRSTLDANTRSMLNANVAGPYGARFPDQYGGCFIEDHVLVVLFTDDLDRHEAALLELVPFPADLTVRRAERTEAARAADHAAIRAALHDQWVPEVATIGMGVTQVRVTLAPWSDEAAEQVRRLAAGRPVEIVEGTRPRYLDSRP